MGIFLLVVTGLIIQIGAGGTWSSTDNYGLWSNSTYWFYANFNVYIIDSVTKSLSTGNYVFYSTGYNGAETEKCSLGSGFTSPIYVEDGSHIKISNRTIYTDEGRE